MAFVGYYRIDLRKVTKRYDGRRLIKVLHESPELLRAEVERLAYFFKREFSYDWVQFEKTDTAPYTAYLIANEDNHIPHVWVGACCFRTREYRDLRRSVEALQWIWIHPYYRNKGILKEWWATLRNNHGDFVVEPPFSFAMKHFLLKHNRDSAFWPIYKGRKPELKKLRAQLSRKKKGKYTTSHSLKKSISLEWATRQSAL